jgi:hypothetical protein
LGSCAEVLSRRPGRTCRACAVFDPHQLRGGARLLEGVGHHHRDRLVVVVDGGPPSSLAVLKLPLPSLPALRAVTMASTPGAARAAARSMEAMRPLAMPAPTT